MLLGRGEYRHQVGGAEIHHGRFALSILLWRGPRYELLVGLDGAGAVFLSRFDCRAARDDHAS